jgi:hypothetical protein
MGVRVDPFRARLPARRNEPGRIQSRIVTGV